MTQEACGENLPSLERARNFKISKRNKDEVRKQKKFQVFNPRQRRSFGKNRIYCPLQGHSTTDYVLSESTGSVFSTGFVRDNIGTGEGGYGAKEATAAVWCLPRAHMVFPLPHTVWRWTSIRKRECGRAFVRLISAQAPSS